jgi:hypothetical protein
MDDAFPSRKSIVDNKKNYDYQTKIIGDIKSIDIEKIDFTNGDFKPRTKIAEKQKVFFWIRLYLSEEDNISTPDDAVVIKYVNSGEELETKFICYAKKNLEKDNKDQIVNYTTEEDKRVLCLMIDSDRINKESDDIPFIRTLFKTSRYYEYQLSKRNELVFTNKNKGATYEYFDVAF